MRRVYASFRLIFILILLNNLTAREQAEDPFAGNYELRNSEEIVFSGNTGGSFTQQVFDYLQFPGIGDSLVGGPFTIPSTDSVGVSSYNHHWYDMDAGNFFGDGSEETVTAWKNQNQTVSLLVSRIDPFSRQWQKEFAYNRSYLRRWGRTPNRRPAEPRLSHDSGWFGVGQDGNPPPV